MVVKRLLSFVFIISLASAALTEQEKIERAE
jgi:hypothetical protein